MSDSFNKIGIIGKRNDPSVGQTITHLAEYLAAAGHEFWLDADCAAQIAGYQGQQAAREDMGQGCDLVVVVGGDGTLLDAGRVVAAHGTPLLGVNLGRLGFMVDVLPADMLDTLDDIFAGNYMRERRLLLEARVEHAQTSELLGPFHALNDVVVRNKNFARVLEFETYMDGAFISHHRADGVIVASPTGSTAYALSGGGPVLHPAMNALALVPICPHTLSDRPLVIDAEHQVEIVVAQGDDTQALFTVDGQTSETLNGGDRVIIKRAERYLNLVHPPGYDYFNILRNKLRWGRGQRSPAPQS